MGGARKETSSSSNEPWKKQKPYLEFGFRQAAKQFRQGPLEFYGGQTYADFTPDQLQAQNQLRQLSQGVTDGSFYDVNQNPVLGTAYRSALENAPSIATSAISAGRYGSGAQAALQARQNIDAYNLATNGVYGQQRGAIGDLSAVGAENQNMEQARIDEQIARYEHEQLAPRENLSNYMNMITGNYGGEAESLSRRKGKSLLGAQWG